MVQGDIPKMQLCCQKLLKPIYGSVNQGFGKKKHARIFPIPSPEVSTHANNLSKLGGIPQWMELSQYYIYQLIEIQSYVFTFHRFIHTQTALSWTQLPKKKEKRRHDWVEFLNGNSTQDHLSMNSNGFSILPQKICKNHQDSLEQNSRSPHSDSIVRILFPLVKSTRTWGIRNNFPNKNPPIPTAKQTKDIQKGVEINLNKNEIKKKKKLIPPYPISLHFDRNLNRIFFLTMISFVHAKKPPSSSSSSNSR